MNDGRLQEAGLWARRLVKASVASAIYHCAKARPRAIWRHQPLVLGYHRVVDDFDEASRHAMPSLLISRAMFERHLQWVGDHFEFISLDEAMRHLEADEPFDRPTAVVSFDDGYRDVYEEAWPVLRRLGVPAAIFLVSDQVGTRQPPIHDRLYALLRTAFDVWRTPERELPARLRAVGVDAALALAARGSTRTALLAARSLLLSLPQRDICRVLGVLEASVGQPPSRVQPLPMTWSMVREMRLGGVTVGSHSKTHAWLVRESAERVDHELSASKAALEAALGGPVNHFAYPDGQFTAATVRAVARAGYRLAFTACRHRDRTHPRLTVPRRILWEYSSVGADLRHRPALLACQVHGLLPRPSTCVVAHG